MDLVTDESVRTGVIRSLDMLVQGTIDAFRHGNASLGVGFLILVVGLVGAVASWFLTDVAVAVIGERAARLMVCRVGRMTGGLVIALVIFQWIARGFGH